MSCHLDTTTFRLCVGDVLALEKVLGGDPLTESAILRLCEEKYGAKNLFWLRPAVADQMLASPDYFKRVAKAMVP